MTNRHQPSQHAVNHEIPEQWEEQQFVDHWVNRDDGRQDQRGPMIEATVRSCGFPETQSINVLDVGSGYGLLAKYVLDNFPNANVTLQDVSEPMFVHAKERLKEYEGKTTFIKSDFSKRDWSNALGGPFDMVVSAIAIHNMYDDNLIASIYKDIHDLISDGGVFANLDYAAQAGGVDTHVQWLKDAGFKNVEAIPQNERIVILRASR
ncbi:MAG: hypothetical protein CL777_05055 [Chloroflexi bacterium]|nr:hypothetical protein [Chloroflexota bacterium]|tara:strand:+ start:1298 stop:1918 length:621 start_codon:yes stop_codon:yes gene_type:complete